MFQGHFAFFHTYFGMAKDAEGSVSERPTRNDITSSASCDHLLSNEQLHLRHLRKQIVWWSLLNVLLLCGCELLSRRAGLPIWLRWFYSIFIDLAMIVLFLQFSLIVLISCCNLTKRTRF
jgi:hypothetical protein